LSQQAAPKRPLTTLQKGINKKVTVRLKNDVEYKGKMNNVDSYMNLIMTDAEDKQWQGCCKLWQSHRKRQ
jgi:small nuclear ribonucleoprotein